jgi:hypothetical protein
VTSFFSKSVDLVRLEKIFEVLAPPSRVASRGDRGLEAATISLMKRILIILFGLTTSLSSTLLAQSLEPGMWKAKTSFKLNGIPLPSSEHEECITPSEAKDVKSTITKELQKNKCELTKWNVKGKKLEASLECKSDELDAKGNLHGQFSKKSYELQGEAKGTYQNVLPSSATVQLSGQWVKACDEKASL